MYALSDFFDGDFERNGKQTYREHYRRVREMARERKMELLDYEIKDGWEPLCKFLGHDVPVGPFPCGNDKQEVNARIKAIINREIQRLLLIFTFLFSCFAFTGLATITLVGI